MPANKINNILIFFFIKFQSLDSSHKKNRTRECGFRIVEQKNYLKSFGRRSVRLHFEHSAIFLIFPFSNMVFIMISPPQSGHMNLCVETDVREFLLAPAIAFLQNEFN